MNRLLTGRGWVIYDLLVDNWARYDGAWPGAVGTCAGLLSIQLAAAIRSPGTPSRICHDLRSPAQSLVPSHPPAPACALATASRPALVLACAPALPGHPPVSTTWCDACLRVLE